MAQGRSTEIITMIKWIRTSRLSIKELSLSAGQGLQGYLSHKKLLPGILQEAYAQGPTVVLEGQTVPISEVAL